MEHCNRLILALFLFLPACISVVSHDHNPGVRVECGWEWHTCMCAEVYGGGHSEPYEVADSVCRKQGMR